MSNAPSLLNDFERLFFAQRIALITSEASEALEANRKEKKADIDKFIESFCRQPYKNAPELTYEQSFEKHMKDTQEDEIADIFIRLMDLAGYLKMDLGFHVEQKLNYNSMRAHKHGKKY